MRPDGVRVEGACEPEEQLLIRAAQTTVADPDALERLVVSDLDWDLVLKEAQRHGTTQLLYRSLDEHCPDQVPAATLDGLRARYERTATQNLRFTQELIDLVGEIRSQEIPVLPYRGPVLASMAYGDVALRQFGDLDLLVGQDEVTDIKPILLERGYKPRYWRSTTTGLTETQEEAYTTFCRDYPFRRDDGIEVELHWRVISRHFPTDIQLDTVWDRRVETTFGGQRLDVLSPEDRLLTLCVHGSRHLWARLAWIVDVAEFLHRYQIDWDAAWRRAREHDCKRMFALGPLLAHDLFDSDLPDSLRKFVENDRKIRELRAGQHEYLFDSSTDGMFETYIQQARMLDSRRDKFGFWLWWAFSPDRPSLERVAFPDSLVGLYRAVRVARLFALASQRAKRTLTDALG